jgi:hypothetical protein
MIKQFIDCSAKIAEPSLGSKDVSLISKECSLTSKECSLTSKEVSLIPAEPSLNILKTTKLMLFVVCLNYNVKIIVPVGEMQE